MSNTDSNPYSAGDVGHFDRFARLYDFFSSPFDADILAEGLAQADRPIERVVDVAGGTGRAVRAIDADERIVLDASKKMLVQAHRRGLACVRGDASRLPLDSESVDAIVISDALHHIGDAEDALAEVERVLNPGGVLVIREFNPATIRGKLLVRGEHAIGMNSVFFTPEELTRMLAGAELVPHVRNRGFDYTVAGVKRTSGIT
ncbi:class I SAM-dependent methyltransferase [Haladaptatus cibarius]|uniref:class I SAM-dependent methyltransferase n=1 Tax=Haladaptatus cibarius TaxID=453847 RepID=UPI000678BAB3|nr:methyltransferase domain-containing protein [Haladaptatus cibarius]